MIKRTLYLGNPYYVCVQNKQLELRVPEGKGIDKIITQTVPLEDIGILIIDHPQITLTHAVLQMAAEFNIALVSCDQNHLPASLQLPLDGHSTQQERFRDQIAASEPLKKQLWQQTVKAKIRNQAVLLGKLGFEHQALLQWAVEVNSGDTMNLEARAAAYYWKTIFEKEIPGFTRDRFGPYPNNLLNYAYAILRATVARALVGSGLLPTLGIHHKNKYNAFCLADDIMEPFRPYADEVVVEIMAEHKGEDLELKKELKARLLGIPAKEIWINGQRSPMMVGLQRCTASLAQCYAGETRRILYPEFSN